MANKQNRRRSRGKQCAPARPSAKFRIVAWMAIGCLAVLVCVALVSIRSITSQSLQADNPIKVWQFTERALSTDASAAEMKAEAERIAAEVVDAYPKSAEALGVVARTYLRFRDEQAAREAWERSLELDPKSVQALFGIGLVGLSQDDYDLASDAFGQALQLQPTDSRIPTALAESLLKSGRVENAIQVLERAIKNRTASVETLLTLAQARAEAEEYEQAVLDFESVLRLAPNYEQALYGLGRAHARLGNREEAAKALSRYRDLGTERKRAVVASNGGEEDRRATRETLAQVHLDAGHVYRQLGDIDQAELLWQKTIAIEPNHVEGLSELLDLYEMTERKQDALAIAKRLCDIQPENAEFWVNVGVLSAHVHQSGQAISAIERALALDPDNPRCRAAHELVTRR